MPETSGARAELGIAGFRADHEIHTPVVTSDLTITDGSCQGVLVNAQASR